VQVEAVPFLAGVIRSINAPARQGQGTRAISPRYPAHPALLEHRELTIIGTTMLLIPRARRRPLRVAALVLRGSATPTDQPARELVQRFGLAQHLASYGSNRPGREWNRLDAVAAT
jgi:hypothetical protein